ncbi:hypothetical protein F1559_005125 [Cyanidiococcus yangmingshanensis]|uniref:Rhodanese domain-containing protein n=1 Tax=Cyanidiococcus yangmingshanensis TaxID=2690220 RepID=A0A7J7IT13_9RHOD|nr:hypothetical protein F1559_005125 [Cyanidiococcus yangmingshanensis]
MWVSALVSPSWLRARIAQCCVLDATWYLPSVGRDARLEFTKARIPDSIRFDIDEVADPETSLPHMLPRSAEAFQQALQRLGIRPRTADPAETAIVCYSRNGAFIASARVWWTFRAFGFDRVFVLDGGFKAWLDAGYEIEAGEPRPNRENGECSAQAGSFPVGFRRDLLCSLTEIREYIRGVRAMQLMDARPRGRFHGIEPEPRPGLRRGHIPGARSIPYETLICNEGYSLRPPDELRRIFSSHIRHAALGTTMSIDGGAEAPLIASCGSGVTAAVVALALHELGVPDCAIYDGSWTEYGALADMPLETTQEPPV